MPPTETNYLCQDLDRYRVCSSDDALNFVADGSLTITFALYRRADGSHARVLSSTGCGK